MTSILAIDPGMSSGLVWGAFSDSEPFTRIGYLQVEGGLNGISRFLVNSLPGYHPEYIICEKFKTRPMARNYRLDELEPIRIEGFLTAMFSKINWQYPEARKLTTGPMKESEDILKNGGLWLTGKSVGMKDADDVNAAQLHALAYLRNIGHEPTVNRFWPVVD